MSEITVICQDAGKRVSAPNPNPIMDVLIAIEHRFWRTPDGSYWSGTIYARTFWSRYLSVFDRVKILARIHDTTTKRDSWQRVDGDQVLLAPVPAYVGPWEFARNFRGVRAAIRAAVRGESAVLLHVPGMVATIAFRRLQPGQPYGVEVNGDPYVHFSKESFSHPLRPFWQWWFTRNQKKQCKHAACCLYVTERALQRRYPPPPGLSVGVSDVEMNDAAFIDSSPRTPPATTGAKRNGINAHQHGRLRMVYVGNLEHVVKAPDVLVTSFAKAVSEGLDAELAMIGDGRERPQIERLAQSFGLGDRLSFLGHVSGGEAIRRQLDASHLFILPSRSEGMPRAMIEAMARGLPCIGSSVGGIPELLPKAALVRPGDVAGLTAKILQFARDPKLRAEMGQQNLATARRFHENILQPKRVVFYQRLRDATQAWQKARRS